MFRSREWNRSVAAAASVCVMSIAGCARPLHPSANVAEPNPTGLRAWSDVSPHADCPYLNVFVDPTQESSQEVTLPRGWAEAEPYRVEFIHSAARSLPAASWRVVEDREQAAFTLRSSGQIHGGAEAFDVTLVFAPTHRTIHQAYVASLNNPRFPLRDTGLFGALIPRFRSSDGELFGAWMTFTVAGSHSEVELHDDVYRFLEFTQAQAFEAVAALCETRARSTEQAIDERDLEKLRKELVDEMQRVRRERLDQKKRAKKLKLEVEPR
jgi:hypothetical protein